MKVLITGGGGFIGGHLVKLLHKSDINYISLVKQLTHATAYKELVVEKYTSVTDWPSLLNNIDVVVHLAGCAHRQFTHDEYEQEDYLPTKELIHNAASTGVKKFVYLSSVNVYEGSYLSAYILSTSSVSPTQLSSKNKVAIENELKKTCTQSKMKYCIIRSPLVYGEGVKANFASLMRFVDKGLPLPFRAIKSNNRSLVSVYNLVDLIKVCIEHPKAVNQIFLASDDNDISTSEMVALMAKVQGKKNLAMPVPVWCFKLAGKLLNKSDVIDRLTGSLQLDITHTKNTLDWKPPYSVEHGFKLAAKTSKK